MGDVGNRLRLLWSDLHGIERGKYLYGDWQARGKANFCLATFPLTFDREILPIPGLAFDVGLPDLEARLDESSLRPGWEPDTTIGIGELFDRDGPLPVDPRGALKRAVEPWRALGLEPQIAFEFEFYLLRPDGEGGWLPLVTPGSRVYGTGTAVDPDGIVDRIVGAATESQMDVEAWCTEFDDSQFEVNIRYRDAVAAADDAFLFRVLTHEIATRAGHRATFLGRPFTDRGGSGLHVNISFRDADGRNALYDEADPEGLTDLARHAMAGMLTHHEGTAAICAPTVNAYKRLLPDMMNGYWANWGHDDRTVAVRISPERGASTRLENRVPDGACNPYLAAATLLHACRFGVEGGMALQAPQPVGDPPAASIHAPDNLEAAVEAMRSDAKMCEALGWPLVDAFTELKRAEWKRYLEAVGDPATKEPTDWELAFYTPFF
ncbi:MAG: glutamine synthetase family protein [Actinomycetota bacterium]|nr:glutamine synthetase family protein [Actinomycetota bacterium]